VLRHIADPRQHLMESDESNNMSQVRVRLGGRRLRGC
jgi:subtilase family serine protease